VEDELFAIAVAVVEFEKAEVLGAVVDLADLRVGALANRFLAVAS
jgi:hypothetical protein